MNPLPPPSRRVLFDLAACLPTPADGAGEASQVRRAFVELTALLAAQEAAWAEIDRITADLTAQVGLPRVALPTTPGESPAYAVDADTIRTRLGPGPAARRLTATLRRRQHQYQAAAEAAGLPAAEARDRSIAGQIADATATLLLAPAGSLADIGIKISLLIALTEPGAIDAGGFPGAFLRTLLADLDRWNTPAR